MAFLLRHIQWMIHASQQGQAHYKILLLGQGALLAGGQCGGMAHLECMLLAGPRMMASSLLSLS